MKYICLFFLLFFLPLILLGQNINGKVYDNTRNPIEGAYIIHLLSDHHAHTNELGSFFLHGVQEGDTLQIMHLGFKTKLVVANNLNKEFSVRLEEEVFQLDKIVVGYTGKSTSILSSIDLKINPVKSSQEVLRKIPGLFIGQHAGGGKAEQIFLRGFDIDHGTDINISVDGLPVNMVSHAHGQGYADLHFLIPETIEAVDFGKGPYYADRGNFATAGYVDFKTKDRLKNSSVNIEFGRFNTARTVGLLNLLQTEKNNAYVAAEYLATDGPFESSQHFNRISLFGKYTAQLSNQDKLSVLASHFSSKWDASGQIPQRAVDNGLISRFGSLDDTEGGNTSRTNLALSFNRLFDKNTFLKNSVFYSKYDFELYSNFTFYLEDPINQDQIKQKENRQLFGVESEWNHTKYINDIAALFQIGAGLRHDNIDNVELSHTLNRKTLLENRQLGDIDETNLYAYANAELDVDKWLFQPSLRIDYFKYNYVNELDSLYNTQEQTKAFVSPKLNIIYNFTNNVQLFLKTGIGFHSNDTRVVLDQSVEEILPAAYGADIGTVLKPAQRLIMNMALWYLQLEQEFVYVGDAGVVEPSGRTRRLGIDVGFRYQMFDWLFLNSDFTYAHARSIDEPEGAKHIPLAPIYTAAGGVYIKNGGFSTGISYRFLADRAANETNSITANGYFITDFNANYEWKNLNIGFSIENLLDNEWNETQFATESRLKNEPVSVEEIHFTPGTPFFIKGKISYKF